MASIAYAYGARFVPPTDVPPFVPFGLRFVRPGVKPAGETLLACSEWLRAEGRYAVPRSCRICGLGPCSKGRAVKRSHTVEDAFELPAELASVDPGCATDAPPLPRR